MKKSYTIFVIIFWLTMMGLLFQREVLPSLVINNPAGYEIELSKDYPVRESWMGIYFKNNKVGFSNTVVSQDVKDGIAGYRINETALLRLNMQGERMYLRVKGNSFFDENYALRDFDYKMVSPYYELGIMGNADGNKLSLAMNSTSGRSERTFKIKNNTMVMSLLNPLLLFKRLDVRKELNFEVFNPITLGTNTARIKNIGTEVIEFNNTKYSTRILEIDVDGIKTKTWVTENGDVLREESPLGFAMLKEMPEYALDITRDLSFSAPDLASDFYIESDRVIEEARSVSYLKIEKDGSIIEISRDNEPPAEKILDIPIKNIPEEPFVQSGSEKIKNLSKKIIGNEKSSWEASKRILHWVYGNIRKVPTLSVPSSLDVLEMRQGDCNEHTVLFTALSRAAGIPTEMVAGLVYVNGVFYYHAWPKVYVGEWINMDPTLGQEIADATHVPLLQGGLKEQLGLVSIIGNLRIKIIDYR